MADLRAGGLRPLKNMTPLNCGSSDLHEPAEVLVELAKRGEIDPWDIDIALATDKFLEHIDSLEREDLRIPARTLLYASILLRMKSDMMEENRADEDLDGSIVGDLSEEDSPAENMLPEPPIRRRAKRPVTLDELILELKKAEMVGRRRALRDRRPSEIPDGDADVSHEEGIEDRIRSLIPILFEMLDKKNQVAFKEIAGDDEIMNYVSILFMANRKQVWIEQEELFEELYLRKHPG